MRGWRWAMREALIAVVRWPLLAAVMLGYGWLAYHAGVSVTTAEAASLQVYVDSLLTTNGDGLCRRMPAHP